MVNIVPLYCLGPLSKTAFFAIWPTYRKSSLLVVPYNLNSYYKLYGIDTGIKKILYHNIALDACFGNNLSMPMSIYVYFSVADPDPNPPDPRVFGPPGSGSGSFYYHAKIVRKALIPTI
jgi:hypothetical protein